jgi:hypothetical protein
LAEQAASLAVTPNEKASLAKFSPHETWDPFAFIDACERNRGSDTDLFLRKIQHLEFQVLLECFLENSL